MNVMNPPFDNVKVRQAVAYAIPYQKIIDAALFGIAKPCTAARRATTDPAWPQATDTTPTSTRRRSCSPMPASGRLETTSHSIWATPGSTSRSPYWSRRASAQIGIKTTINKVPGANWRTEIDKKTMPLYD